MTVAAGQLVAATNLAKRFGATVAVDGVCFTAAAGEIFGLVGPDGAGKTTVLRMLSGVMKPNAGAIEIDGVDVVAAPEMAKRHLSYMPQRFGLYEDLTVAENIRFYADIFEVPKAIRAERQAKLLAAANIAAFGDRLAGQLSGGMKQKLGLVCSLIHTPKVLLLDEPTTGVDPVSRRDFWQILYSLRETGVTIVLSTAYLDEAERCDRLGLMQHGRLDYCDTPDGLKARMPYDVVRVVVNEPRRARNVVAAIPGIASCLVVGDTLRIAVDDSDRRISSIRAALDLAGLTAAAIVAVNPSIEDVFVALLGTGAGHG